METIAPAETPHTKSLARRAGKALIWFFVIALALTYLSRALGDSLKARVRVGYTSASMLDESVEGTGTWTVGETQLYTTYFVRRISQVYVKAGQRIEVGTPLFAYDVSTVSGKQAVSDNKLRAAKRALERAEAALETAEDPENAQRVVDSARQALLYAEFTYAQYDSIQNGGVVRATFSGTLVSCDLTAGKASVAGSTGFTVAPDGVAFSLRVPAKEAERIAPGDSVVLFDNGQKEDAPLTVESVSAPDAENNVTVLCAGDGGRERLIGAKQEWTIKKQSQKYNLCVPITALRQSGPDSYYVLVLSEKETILGTELYAAKVPVTLLARDSARAAVEGNLSERDKLITESSKELRDGDLVVEQDA